MIWTAIEGYVYGLVIGVLVMILISFFKKTLSSKNILNANELAKKIKHDAETEAQTLVKEAVLEAKEKWYKQQKKYEQEIEDRKKRTFLPLKENTMIE